MVKAGVYRWNRWTGQAGRHADLPPSRPPYQPASFIVNYGQFWGKPSRVHWYINSLLFMRSIKSRGFFFPPLPPLTIFEVLVRCCHCFYFILFFLTFLLVEFWSHESFSFFFYFYFLFDSSVLTNNSLHDVFCVIHI